MKTNYTLIFFFATALMLGVSACHKDAQIEPKSPKMTTHDVSFTATTANFYWEVDFPGKVSSIVKLSRNADMSEATTFGDGTPSSVKGFLINVSGLSPETKYYYCFEIWNPGIYNRSEVKSFTTHALQKPTVTTAAVTQFDFAQATAIGGGEVTSDGYDVVTERGIYFGTNPNPATTGTKIAASTTGTGSFTCTMTGLVEETIYYVCAYATNGQGTSYGSEKSFSYNPPPAGALYGVFSVSSSKQVYFSQGNLQYRASDERWRFAEHQYDYIGSDNSNISSTYSDYIDLFGWGTSGWYSGAVCYEPWSISDEYANYYLGGSSSNNQLTGSYANADWGVYNAIYNGGNMSGLWRTLTKDEWVYVFEGRNNASSKYGHGKVNGVCGVILLPDSWTLPSGLNFTAGNSNWINSYKTSQWALMEANGAVFLPAAGRRWGVSAEYYGSEGAYWSADSYDAYGNKVGFYHDNLNPSDHYSRAYGLSVRLVTPAE